MNAGDFEAFFRALHGHSPFPWQAALARRVVEPGGAWPEVIAVPTAAGKTAAIDVAVFALACAAGGSKLSAARRIFFVIDRRIVVDEAFDRARGIKASLEDALAANSPGVLGEAARALAGLGGEGRPLRVKRMRGGMARDEGWARSPAQPTVCVSTVDQLGSRLLFRGYGVGRARPIHAALAGNDALVILDEAHLADPFRETVGAIGKLRGLAERKIAAAPGLSLVRMTATPGGGAIDESKVHRATEADRKDPVLGRRLEARKLVRLVPPVPGSEDEPALARRRRLSAALCDQAIAIRTRDPEALAIGIVVNRVATARAVREALAERVGADGDVALFTGRQRPLERDELWGALKGRLKVGREPRSQGGRPLYLVATQCIEVGVNIDLDGLVSECASLDAIRQRFGRLDRLGERRTSHGAIVVGADAIAKDADDPVYGGALAATWKTLLERCGKPKRAKKKDGAAASEAAAPELDLGIAGFGQPPTDAALRPPERHAPVLLPAYLDLWSQTAPEPSPGPDVPLFLHGPQSGPADVQVVWRADLDGADARTWSEIVSLRPPLPEEAMPVPFLAAREWLAGREERSVADVEGERLDEDRPGQPLGRSRLPVLRWLGSEESLLARGEDDIRPGDTLVVPSSRGGADRFGWHPASGEEVSDLGDAAAWRRETAGLRLHPALVRSWVHAGSSGEEATRRKAAAEEALDAILDAEPADMGEALSGLASVEGLFDWVREVALALALDRERGASRYPEEARGGPDRPQPALVRSKKRRGRKAGEEPEERLAPEVAQESIEASLLEREVTLHEHTGHVVEWTRRFARLLRLDAPLAEDLELAARLHDLGKLDPRFQVLLHGGDKLAAVLAADRPLAKSDVLSPRDPGAGRRALELSEYPVATIEGLRVMARHEALSVAIVERDGSALGKAHDPGLVLHLIASHHGHARPLFPVVPDPAPKELDGELEGVRARDSTAHGLERLDSGVCERFWRVTRRYGWYGVAWLETILRIADQRASAEEAARPRRSGEPAKALAAGGIREKKGARP